MTLLLRSQQGHIIVYEGSERVFSWPAAQDRVNFLEAKRAEESNDSENGTLYFSMKH